MKKSILFTLAIIAMNNTHAVNVKLINWSTKYSISVPSLSGGSIHLLPRTMSKDLVSISKDNLKVSACVGDTLCTQTAGSFSRIITITEEISSNDLMVFDAGRSFWSGLPGITPSASATNTIRYQVLDQSQLSSIVAKGGIKPIEPPTGKRMSVPEWMTNYVYIQNDSKHPLIVYDEHKQELHPRIEPKKFGFVEIPVGRKFEIRPYENKYQPKAVSIPQDTLAFHVEESGETIPIKATPLDQTKALAKYPAIGHISSPKYLIKK